MTRKSRVRDDKIMELRAFFDQFEGRSLTRKLFFLHRAIQKGNMTGDYTQAEIGFAHYKDEKVIERVLNAVSSAYRILRKWKINRSQAIFPTENEEGYTVMVHKDRSTYENDAKRYEIEIDGCQSNDRKFRKITGLSKQQLEAQARADEIAIENEEIGDQNRSKKGKRRKK